MATNSTGFTPNVARQAAQVNQNQNRNIQAQNQNQGPRAATFANATATTNSPAPVSTAVAAPGSAPAAPVGGTTAPTSPAAAARTAPAQTQAQTLSMHPGAMAAMMGRSGVASQAVTASGVGETKDKNKEDTNKAINKANADGDKSSLALKDSNSETGSEASDISGANSANSAAA